MFRLCSFLFTTFLLFTQILSAEATVLSSRDPQKKLGAPEDGKSFSFMVLTHRAMGKLQDADIFNWSLVEANHLNPDFVFTIGDLLEGYHTQEEWERKSFEQARLLKELNMPWYPVAGHHDMYWNGNDRIEEQYSEAFERIYGPVWYAFPYMDSWFICLFSGRKAPGILIEEEELYPDLNSPQQMRWLKGVLEKTRAAKNVFIITQQTRFIKGAPDKEWDSVHEILKEAGNVRAVFAGDANKMEFASTRDGIDYFSLASDRMLWKEGPKSRTPHYYHFVTVSPEGLYVSKVPVGSVRNVQGEVAPTYFLDQTVNADPNEVGDSQPVSWDPNQKEERRLSLWERLKAFWEEIITK